jgi:hypothetical protein
VQHDVRVPGSGEGLEREHPPSRCGEVTAAGSARVADERLAAGAEQPRQQPQERLDVLAQDMSPNSSRISSSVNPARRATSIAARRARALSS